MFNIITIVVTSCPPHDHLYQPTLYTLRPTTGFMRITLRLLLKHQEAKLVMHMYTLSFKTHRWPVHCCNGNNNNNVIHVLITKQRICTKPILYTPYSWCSKLSDHSTVGGDY